MVMEAEMADAAEVTVDLEVVIGLVAEVVVILVEEVDEEIILEL
jgi:hypothetical protein